MALTMLTVLGEAVCLFPTSGSFIDHAARFVDPALGFAIGFCEWFGALTVVAAEGAVFPVIISYWTTEVPAAALMTIYLGIDILYASSGKKSGKLLQLLSMLSILCQTGGLPSSSSARVLSKWSLWPSSF